MDFDALKSSFSDSPRRFFLARHLDSPLIADKLKDDCIDALRSAPLTREGRSIAGSIAQLRSQVSLDLHRKRKSTDDLRPIKTITPLTPYEMIQFVNSYRSSTTIPIEAAQVANEWRQMVSLILGITSADGLQHFIPSTKGVMWLEKEKELDLIWDDLNNQCARGSSHGIVRSLLTEISEYGYLDRHRLILGTKDGQSYRVATFDMFLALKDCCGARGRSFLAADYFNISAGMSHRIQEQISWQEECIKELGNDGYEIAKQTESLSKAWLTHLTDPAFRSSGPYVKMQGKIKEKLKKLLKNRPDRYVVSTRILNSYHNILEQCSVQETVELFGLQKLTMYPHIYSAKGGASAAAEAFHTSTTSYQTIKEMRACWATMFTLGYISKHHHWPALSIPPNKSKTRLSKWYTSGFTRFTLSDVDLDDWDEVRFHKIDDFDYHDNYLDLIDDKAISYYRDNLRAYWDGVDSANSERRLLLEMLQRKTVNLKSICDIVAERKVPIIWKVVSLYPKEKELKVNARMFSMMVFEMRTFFTCLEANLADKIFPYLRSQTMTKDKVSVTHQFYNLTSLHKDPDTVRLFIECDLSRWNLRWRGDVVHYIGRDVDDLLGVHGLYTYVHEFFAESVIVVRTPRLRPEGIETLHPPASDLVWYKHQGGFEGIAQKLWTICTYAMIDRALRTVPCSYILIGQGDNQILSLVAARNPSVTPDEQARQLSQSVTSKLSVSCAEVNQELKPEECLESRTVITYSKNIYVDGAELFTSIKFASKLLARTSDEIPSLSADLSGLSSACLAAAEYNRAPLKLGVLLAFYMYLEVDFRVRHGREELMAVPPTYIGTVRRALPHLVATIMRVPSHFGGFSVASFADFLYRGGADPAAKDWSAIVRSAEVDPLSAGIKEHILMNQWFSPDADPLTLLESPYALPLTPRESMRGRVSQLAMDFLGAYSKNTDVSVLTSAVTQEYTRALQESLLHMNPFHPLLASEIFGSSPVAETARLSRMFISTRTIQVASRKAGHDSSTAILETSGSEAFNIINRLRIVSVRQPRPRSDPVTEYQRFVDFRNIWVKCFNHQGIPVTSLTGVEAVPPLLYPWFHARRVNLDSAVKICVSPAYNRRHTRGPFSPYFGAQTKIARTEHGYKIVGDTRPARAIERLGEMIHTSGIGPGLKEMIRQLALHRGPVDLASAALQRVQIGGTVHHRFDASRRERGAYISGTGNLASWAFFVSDEISGISKSTKDFGLMFQEFYVCLLGIVNVLREMDSSELSYVESGFLINGGIVPEIRDDSLDSSVVPFLDPDARWSDSRIVYDKTVGALALKGPIAVKNVIPVVDNDGVTTETLMLEAVRAEFTRVVRLGVDTDYVLSAVTSSYLSVSIDLSEALRLQLQRIVDAAARCAWLNICYRWVTRIIADDRVIKFHTDLRHICSNLAKSILPLLEYSALLSDVSVGFSLGSAGYVHGAHVDKDLAILEGLITQQVRKMIRTSPDQLSPTVIFATEPGGYGSLVLMARLGHILMYASKGALRYSFVVAALRATRLRDVAAIVHESDRQRAIWTEVLRISLWTDLPFSIKDHLTNYVKGRHVYLIEQDHRVAVRKARLLVLPPELVTSADQDVELHGQSEPLELVQHRADLVTLPDTVRPVYSQALDNLYVDSHRFGRHYLLWAHMYTALRPRQTTIIGVGRGVAVLAALDSGCNKVIGSDCGSEYNLRRVRSGYPPEAALHSHRSACFSWEDSTLPRLLSQASLRESILEVGECSEGSLVLIDPMPHPSVEELRHLPLSSLGHVIIAARFYVTEQEVLPLKQALSTFLQLVYYQVFQFPSRLIVLAAGLTSDKLTLYPPPGQSDPSWNGGPPCPPSRSRPKNQSHLYTSCDRISLGLLSSRFKVAPLRRMMADLLSEVGRDIVSSNYQEWSGEIFKIIVLWIVFDSPDKRKTILEMVRGGDIAVQIGTSVYSVTESLPYYRRLLAGPVAYLATKSSLLEDR